MKVNPIYYRSLLDKSINCVLSAIELYNKPDFEYREDFYTRQELVPDRGDGICGDVEIFKPKSVIRA